MEDFKSRVVTIRKSVSKAKNALIHLRSWKFQELLGYILQVMNHLSSFSTSPLTTNGFQLDGLTKLSDFISPKQNDVNILFYICEQILDSESPILEFITTCRNDYKEVNDELFIMHSLIPEAIVKVWEIIILLHESEGSSDTQFIENLNSFMKELIDIITQINEDLLKIDYEMSKYGGVKIEVNDLANHEKAKLYLENWSNVKKNKILKEQDIKARIDQDLIRWGTFLSLSKFFNDMENTKLSILAKKESEMREETVKQRTKNSKEQDKVPIFEDDEDIIQNIHEDLSLSTNKDKNEDRKLLKRTLTVRGTHTKKTEGGLRFTTTKKMN